MQDRIVQYPNRFRLTPVDGVENTYDVTPVPGTVIQEGTALNKANLLTDATATLLGLAGNPSVNDAFGKLTERARVVTGSYVGTGTGQVSLNLGFRPKYFFVMRQNSYMGQFINYPYHGIFIDGFTQIVSFTTDGSISSAWNRPVTTSNNGISWTLVGCGYDNGLNDPSRTYLYVAVG